MSKASVSGDRLEEAVDYEADRGQDSGAHAAQGHINLAETLAERIAALALEVSRVVNVVVRVEKLHALANAEAAGVEIERTR